MRRKRWWLQLISILSILRLSGALPVRQSAVGNKDFELSLLRHVNKTCLGFDCDDEINYRQLELILSHMNFNADPCENFHEYACGNWKRAHPDGITTMRVANDQLTEVYVDLMEQWLQEAKASQRLPKSSELHENELQRYAYQVRDAEIGGKPNGWLSEIPHWDRKTDVVLQKMLKYYETCKASEHQGKQSLRQYFEVIKGKISWRQHDFNWLETLALLGRYGYKKQFLIMEVTRYNSTDFHMKVVAPYGQEPLSLTNETYDILKDFTEKSESDLKLEFERLEKQLEDIKCQDCAALRNASPDKRLEDDDDKDLCGCYDDEVMTFGELQQHIPEIDWQLFLGSQVRRTIRPNDSFTVANLNYIKKQMQFINSLEKDLTLLYTIARFLQFLKEQQHNLLDNEVSGINCMRQMRKIFYLPMNYIYERAIYSKVRAESETIILEIFKKLKTEFSKRLAANRMHLGQDILAELQTKLDVMSINVGNVPSQVGLDFFYDYASRLNFTDNYYNNYLHALEVFYMQYNQLPDLLADATQNPFNSFNLHTPEFPDNLDSSPYYHCLSNAIILPFTYLRPPFYDHRLWAGFVYGDLVSSLGHELIHAFDATFLAYDAYGNLGDLLDRIKLNPHYNDNIECLRNGTKFLEERTADISGSRLALNAFSNLDPNALANNGKLYFLQFAQFFCGAAESSTFEAQDPNHDMDSIRVNYTPKHIPEFAEIFQCPLGSSMRPEKICELW